MNALARSRVHMILAAALAVPVAAGLAVAAPVGQAAAATGPSVFGWGWNARGEAGTLGTSAIGVPSPLTRLTAPVRQLASDESQTDESAALLADGTVDTWGSNAYGGLGDGTTTERDYPAPVPGLSGITEFAVDDGFMLAVGSGGTVWTWGNNSSGQLGIGTATNQTLPVHVPGLSGITQVAAGLDHALALRSDGTVWAWGANVDGVLGNGPTTNQALPVQVPGLSGITQVAAGGDTSFALRSDGTLFAWGSNAWGLLGNGSKSGQSATPAAVPGLTGVTQIAVSTLDALAIAGPSRTVWAWGYNAFGEIGNGTDRIPQLRPVQLAVSGAVQVTEGFGASAAVLADGRLMVWGANSDYGLGMGTAQADQVYPVQNPFLSGVSQAALGFEIGLAIGFSTSARVPDVRGDDLPAASAALDAAGFVLGAVSYTGVCSNPDRVVAQTPPAGAFAMIGSAVSVAVGRLKLCL